MQKDHEGSRRAKEHEFARRRRALHEQEFPESSSSFDLDAKPVVIPLDVYGTIYKPET